jgi:hypothetical protein
VEDTTSFFQGCTLYNITEKRNIVVGTLLARVQKWKDPGKFVSSKV